MTNTVRIEDKKSKRNPPEHNPGGYSNIVEVNTFSYILLVNYPQSNHQSHD